jgi:phage repressor protein C with HTH and peptisase S24 domain
MQHLILQSCNAPHLGMFANNCLMVEGHSDKALIEALIDWSKSSASDLARTAKLTPSTLTRPLNYPVKHRLSTPTLEKLKLAYPRFPGWANLEPDLPDAPEDQAYVTVNVLPSYAGAGGGGTGEGDRLVARLPRRLIEEELGGRPSDFELIDIRGDSAEPNFFHGDQILIDTRDRDPRQPGPFAIWDDDGYVLKLVERVPTKRGWYRVFSANTRYSSYEIEENEATIRGRPVWFARRL